MIGTSVRRREQPENEAVQLTDLRTRPHATRVAFADHMDRLVAGDRTSSSPEGTKMLAGGDPTFDGPMILFQDVLKSRLDLLQCLQATNDLRPFAL